MRALVTGGCGFIASHLVDLLLLEGHEVRVLDNLSTGRLSNLQHVGDKAEIVKGDLADGKCCFEACKDIDWVFHLAALADIVPSIQKPDLYFRSNVSGTFHLLEACRRSEVKKLIYAASSSCYGIPDSSPTSETAAIRPQYPYALTKRMGEELVLHWAQTYRLPALSLRFFNVYGPRSRTSGTYGAVFGVFLAQKLAGKPFTVVGDGEQTRDFTYVSDVVRAVLSAAESDKSGEVYNVGSGATVSINKLTDLLEGDKIYIPKRPGEPDCTFADIGKIQKDFSWSPQVSIGEGVQMLLDNIDYWREAPVWEPSSIAIETEDWFKYLSPASASS